MARPFSLAWFSLHSADRARPSHVWVQTVVLCITQRLWRGRVKVKSLSVMPSTLLINQATLGTYLYFTSLKIR